MTLLYKSTRNTDNVVPASQAILQGLATDGGLYVPTELPKLELNFDELAQKSYQEVAYLIMSAFYPDFTEEELRYCIDSAYDTKFDDAAIAPVVKKGNDYYLELFHGSTIAFKDMALSILPYLMTTSAKKNGVDSEIVILTATSGDTGKAAMAGFADVPGTKIIVFYPKDGVSKIQEKQMVTQKGDNTYVVAIDGNFDDAQSMVKSLFNDAALKQALADNGKQFSSANSINIGRLIPQVVYYVYAYAQLVKQGEIKNGEEINVSVPTGNFGNILAGYYAKQLGVPFKQLICASNPNKVLTDFFQTGVYDRNRPFFVTSSPSMDILISSNLERLIFHLTGDDVAQTNELMNQLTSEGKYEITPEMKARLTDFIGDFATEEETKATIEEIYQEAQYVLDPHTAVAASVLAKHKEANTPSLVVSTASPYKFPRVVVEALTQKETTKDDFDLVDELYRLSNVVIPQAVTELLDAPVRHNRVVAVNDMKACVTEILDIK
ncbi:threonine synthase [Enterococcus saccharolyticus]|uniref:threonine synthase n=1 Tax=Enterococcus saccharolyticus TaxID=41997 RepID=UPI001E4A115B|nr:threonine synthase [Enterococcus saccharolyticus]MCD5003408.1 threonine synthase [Enterococcus saccharolyticus]